MHTPTLSDSGLTRAVDLYLTAHQDHLGCLLKIWRSGPHPRPVKQESLTVVLNCCLHGEEGMGDEAGERGWDENTKGLKC